MRSLVSIITPSYNSSKYIEQTIQSVLSQTYGNWELIIVDDCSTDSSVEVIKAFTVNNSKIKLVELQSNSGAAEARNKAIAMAKGEFLAFLDSDDVWKSCKLEKQINFMGSEIDFSFTAYELIDGLGKKLNREVDSNQTGFFDYLDMLKKKATLGCSTVILRRSAFPDISMPLLRTGQDYALWLKLLKTGNNAYVFSQIMGQYRILPNSISRNKFKKALRQWQIYRDIEELSILKSVNCFSFYAWRAFFRK